MTVSFFILSLLLLSTTHINRPFGPNAQEIVDRCIEAHGGLNYGNSAFQFDFRDKHYTYEYADGVFRYSRRYTDKKARKIYDVLTNEGFERTINDKPTRLSAKQIRAYSNSVNSVIYFAMLPHFLNDEAAIKSLLKSEKVDGRSYFKISVTFDEEGGGTDHDDIFVYWINKESYTLDFLAYSYRVNGGGVRFRKAFNSRVVGGIRFQDYINYKYTKGTPVEELDKYYINGQLEELSRIELKNIVSVK